MAHSQNQFSRRELVPDIRIWENELRTEASLTALANRLQVLHITFRAGLVLGSSNELRFEHIRYFCQNVQEHSGRGL